MEKYKFLLKTVQRKKWQKIGLFKRAGIITPLFFVWSKKSLGMGEIPDLKLLIDWCQKTGNSILQLLPLNDTGFNFSPYSPQSSFALDPLYLSLRDLIGIEKKDLDILAKRFPLNTKRVNYQIKGEKLKILWQIFLKIKKFPLKFEEFIEKNRYWLNDYCLFRILKEAHQEKPWEEWEEKMRNRDEKALEEFKKKHEMEIKFQQWLQWQLFEQLREVRLYAKARGIFLKGDSPWLISRDSADVWSHREYFDLNFSSGAPPDAFSKKGQRWGMPPLNWEKIFEENFVYFKEKLKYAENFYDILRIDHVVGIFRIWKIANREPEENKGLNGFFDPQDEKLWERQGKQILLEMIKNTKMLICAENLGTVPFCCNKILKELGIPGMRVQRWNKNWKTFQFKRPKDYQPLSVATLSTHDTSNWLSWWRSAPPKEKAELFKILFKKNYSPKIPEKKLLEKNLEMINSSSSIFCILLLLEWLFLGDILKGDPDQYRFNTPGKISKKNWTLRMPIPLEELLESPLNAKVKKIIEKTGRV